TGIVTEHGILFVDEDVQFQELYDGQVFPPYLYGGPKGGKSGGWKKGGGKGGKPGGWKKGGGKSGKPSGNAD
ncbi:MAG: hypothetical protein IJ991_18115, partial [Thermoguttaceae bacterium]|nr:hypothetical protein [Thermoguttaceae bacterium]